MTTPTTPSEPTGAAGKTWRPTTAGILNIVAGVIGLIVGIVLAAIHGAMSSMAWMFGFGAMGTAPFIAGATIAIIFGIVAILGGVYSLRRKIWGLALAGSILAFFLVFFLGIPSIIFVAQAKKEFT